jgi:hypothetical protein
VTTIFVTIVGGGGAAGFSYPIQAYAGGGGGGGAAYVFFPIYNAAGYVCNFTIGNGGQGAGANGTSTTFSILSGNFGINLIAGGGYGGTASPNTEIAGSGGQGGGIYNGTQLIFGGGTGGTGGNYCGAINTNGGSSLFYPVAAGGGGAGGAYGYFGGKSGAMVSTSTSGASALSGAPVTPGEATLGAGGNLTNNGDNGGVLIAYGFFTSQVVLTSGNGTWNVPSGVTTIYVSLVGGGGGGGGWGYFGKGFGGGAGGGASGYWFVELTNVAGTSFTYSVGVGGPAGNNGVVGSGAQPGTTGTDGTNTTFTWSKDSSVNFIGQGGKGGTATPTAQVPPYNQSAGGNGGGPHGGSGGSGNNLSGGATCPSSATLIQGNSGGDGGPIIYSQSNYSGGGGGAGGIDCTNQSLPLVLGGNGGGIGTVIGSSYTNDGLHVYNSTQTSGGLGGSSIFGGCLIGNVAYGAGGHGGWSTQPGSSGGSGVIFINY